MKILMYGFGSGNNIEPWLEFYQRNKQYKVTYICRKFDFDKELFSNIEVIEISKIRIFKLFLKIRSGKYDITYIQGLYDYVHILLIFLFAKSNQRIVQIWNNTNYFKATLKNKKKWQILPYKLVLSLTTRFYFTWYGTYTNFSKEFPKYKQKLYIQPWGIREKIIQEGIKVSSQFAQNTLAKLNKDDIFLFWPENLDPDEHIDVFIQALSKIKHRERLKVLIYSGHQKGGNSYLQVLKNIILENNLNFIEIAFGEYLPFSDIMALWERANLTIKLSSKDQLSNGIIEAMYFKTPIILNNWLPYKKLPEHGFNIKLVELTPISISEALDEIIYNLSKDIKYYDAIGNDNSKLTVENFNFDKNIEKLMMDLQSNIN